MRPSLNNCSRFFEIKDFQALIIRLVPRGTKNLTIVFSPRIRIIKSVWEKRQVENLAISQDLIDFCWVLKGLLQIESERIYHFTDLGKSPVSAFTYREQLTKFLDVTCTNCVNKVLVKSLSWY